MMDSFYGRDELLAIGFAGVGEDVLVSRKASVYGAGMIRLGSHVRVDDFCVLSGAVAIGDHVHVSAGAYLFAGEAGIILGDFSAVSSRCAVYAVSDDYSGMALANPTVPESFRLVDARRVTLGRHALLGTGCTVLPGVTVGDGCSVGAMSLVKTDLDPWGVYVGVPCRRVAERSRSPLGLEQELVATEREACHVD